MPGAKQGTPNPGAQPLVDLTTAIAAGKNPEARLRIAFRGMLRELDAALKLDGIEFADNPKTAAWMTGTSGRIDGLVGACLGGGIGMGTAARAAGSEADFR